MAYLARFDVAQERDLSSALQRNKTNSGQVGERVRSILEAVRTEGDGALLRYAQQFDRVQLESLRVRDEEFAEAEKLVSPTLKAALSEASRNIRTFHEAQFPQAEQVEVAPGIELRRKVVPLGRVGLYIPGGTAPLFSTVLMLGIPAQVAGCPSVVLTTPPGKEGKVHPAILYAAKLCNIKDVYKVGGAQAIAALAYGTQTIKAVDKIFGPGNQYVTEAKKQVSSECCAIDMPAGPSEVMVVANPLSDPAFVASDLLSQAEHGSDSQAMLVVKAGSEEGFAYLDRVEEELSSQLAKLGRQNHLVSSLSSSRAFVCPDLDSCASLVNDYAPEHLIINLSEAEDEELASLVVNAGSLFLGPYSCETAGDYASGTNHTLPTNGWARSYSGVSTDSFLKKITVQKLSREALDRLSPTLLAMAEEEQLSAHRNAVAIRLGGER
ncbi:MAG: histidinol dehydrogenase [Spirochaetia bacterium]|nr:histidinol dehydrogenase [Spirochaetia bacterium]NCC90853.1 histidinol dehydrogenase [Spirochaetia bacterium]